MKKLINDPVDFVAESVMGFAAANEEIVRASLDPMYVVRADAPIAGKVALLSGGGSGHEPLHAGFVGLGMLDVAVPGAVFTSPPPDPILAATRAVDSGAGVLYIVKNYTGDVMNFEVAAELAAMDGHDVVCVIVNDDVAVEDSTFTAGRRGVAGTILVEKLAGAAAERGAALDAVAAIARRAITNLRTMGVAIEAPVVPHVGRPSFDLRDDEMEIGIGIHGEPGRYRAVAASANDVADRLLEAVLADLGVRSGERVLLLVNGMGGTPESELHIVYGRARSRLESRGIEVARSLVGSFVTSLEMRGCSITLLRMDDEFVELWDAPVHTARLRWRA